MHRFLKPIIAAAVAAIAFDRRCAVLDGNIERVISRLYAIETPLPAAKLEMRQRVAELTPADRPGDFAQAYVIAHEFGHHVQTLFGIERDVRQAQQEHPEEANELSVRMELQADCFAGVWGHAANRRGRAAEGRVELDPGDFEEGIRAAGAIGDDRIQRQTTGHVSPDRFTHGSSAERVSWLRRGLDNGRLEACDTFASESY